MSKKKIQALTTQVIVNHMFGQLRYLTTEDGEIYFAAVDVCKILGIKNVAQAVSRLDEDEYHMFNIGYSGSRGKPNLIFVNEPGLYRLIFKSRKKTAKEFQRWVYHEVLPSIRKYGYYNIVKPEEKIVEKTFTEAAEEGFFDELNEKFPDWELDVSKITLEKNENGEVWPVYHLKLNLQK